MTRRKQAQVKPFSCLRPGPGEARALFGAVAGFRGRDEHLFDEVLAPAIPVWSGFADAYARYRRFASAPAFARDGSSPEEDLWTFYALSRLFEWLVRGAQHRPVPGEPPAASARLLAGPLRDALLRFFAALGMEPLAVYPRYHPFFHEIAAAETDPALGDAVVVEGLWPGLWFGDLVFARAGVRARCGPAAAFDPVLAVRSTLYFAWTREHRPVSDLSHGWGSNSQWRTRFRRDYADGAVLRYNVDGRIRLTAEAIVTPPGETSDPADDDLTPAERMELLTHRCFVRTAKCHGDRWPFDDTYAEPAPATDWIW